MDPWKHRSELMCCASCMSYVEKVPRARPTTAADRLLGARDIVEAQPAKAKIGRCRRHAPTMNGYPVVFSNDWCGDHKLDENSIQ